MSQNNPLVLARLSLHELQILRNELQITSRALLRDHKMMAARFEMINAAIRQHETTEEQLLISDHAVIRWLERIEGMDLEPIRQKIRDMAIGNFDPKDDHEVIVDEDQGAVLIIRGRRKDINETLPSMVVTVLDAKGPIPDKNQLSVMKKHTDEHKP